MLKRYVHVCKRCGWPWESNEKAPVKCAKCRSPYWDKDSQRPVTVNGKRNAVPFYEYHCGHCDTWWRSRSEEVTTCVNQKCRRITAITRKKIA